MTPYLVIGTDVNLEGTCWGSQVLVALKVDCSETRGPLLERNSVLAGFVCKLDAARVITEEGASDEEMSP